MDLSTGHLDRLFQALGDPTRRVIVERLANGSASVSDLAAPLNMTLPAALEHIRKLEAAGLVTTAKTGRVRNVTLVTESYAPIRTWLDQQRATWEACLDRLERFVLTPAPPEGEAPEQDKTHDREP